MDKFKEIFLAETTDLLKQLENLSLELEAGGNTSAIISEMFRIVHTVKGSAAMFGYEQTVDLAHEFETLLDKYRTQNDPITTEFITLSFQVRDLLEDTLEEGQYERPETEQAIKEISDQLRAYAPPPLSDAELDAKKESERVEAIAASIEKKIYRIVFTPTVDFFQTGGKPELLLAELRGMGELAITPNINETPRLQELDPEECHISWEASLRSSVSLETVCETFMLLDKHNYIDISEVSEQAAAPIPGDAYTIRHDVSRAIRVSGDRVDKLVNLMGELVTFESSLVQAIENSGDANLLSLMERGAHVIANLKNSVMELKMTPVRAMFERFRRVVRDLAKELGKDVELVMVGESIELEKTLLDATLDSITQIVRNAVFHGIGFPEVRASRNKPRTGVIEMKAQRVGSFVDISIFDDGGGMNLAKLEARARAMGLLDENAPTPSDKTLHSYVFYPGFSTADTAGTISGRGVGLDIVKKSITALGGFVSVSSIEAIGTTFTLRVPSITAILDVLPVGIGRRFFVLPLISIAGCISLNNVTISSDRDRDILIMENGDKIPYFDLHEYFREEIGIDSGRYAAIIGAEEKRVAFLFDKFYPSTQIVTKPLGRFYQKTMGLSGVCFLGSGSLALILDLHQLAEKVF